MDFPRLIVAQAPPPSHSISPARMRVGIMRWTDPTPTLTIIVKATFSFGQDAPFEDGVVKVVLAGEHEPLSRSLFAEGASGEKRLVYPTDFVPYKPAVDLLLKGHGYGGTMEVVGDETRTRITASFSAGGAPRRFHLVAQGKVSTIPLLPGYLRDDSGAEAPPVGPIATAALADAPAYHPPDFDFSVYNAATPAQRVPELEPSTPLKLKGLSPRGEERTLLLPDLTARAFADYADRDRLVECVLDADTLFLDTDRERLTLAYRGTIALESIAAREIGRLVVTFDRASQYRSVDDIFRELPRGDFFYALTAADLEPGAPPVPEQSVELKMARYASWGYPKPPSPTTTLERYAAIGAALAEGREPRAEVLRRHEVEAESWVVEERAWSSKISADRELAVRYGALFVAAQDALAEPREADRGVQDYLRLAAAMERRPKAEVLKDAKMTDPAWQRLKRRCSAQIRKEKAEKAAQSPKALPPRPAIKALAPAPPVPPLLDFPREGSED